MSKYRLPQDRSFFSFIIVPPHGKSPISFRLSFLVTVLIIFLVVIFSIIIGLSIYNSAQSRFTLYQYDRLKEEASLQQKELEQYRAELEDIKKTIEDLLEKEKEIRKTLGAPNSQTVSAPLPEPKTFKAVYAQLQSETPDYFGVRTVIDFVKENVYVLEEHINLYYDKLERYKNRFAITPSIWPLYGSIRSGFGWRVHPVTSQRRLHTGIDIPSWVGAPIKVTADGVVEYADWAGGYGYAVVVNHDFGYRTLYGHASQLLTRKGDVVKKGQVIAQVGSTGLSTGPHLHYEVIRWRKPVSPVPYLDLDMFTASKRVW